MKLGLLYDTFKNILIGLICLLIAHFLFGAVREISLGSGVEQALEQLPNYNYVSDIKDLRDGGKLSEALEMSRFVIRHPDMPGQEEAKALEKELEEELTSLWGRTKRATRGFAVGNGNSIEEIGGGIVSDMIIYGDIRDLVKQGYYKVTDKDTDPVIVSLATIGLLTEVVDAVDWAPAVLKAFRKVGALSMKFADFVITSCKKSAKARKLDSVLKSVFTDLGKVVDKIGLGRASTIFKYVDTPEDLAAIAKIAQKNTDAAYFTVKNGGKKGVDLINAIGDMDAGVAALAKAAKKGPRAIEWLSRGGKGYKYVLRTRFGARLLKNIRLERPKQLIIEIGKKYPSLRYALWATSSLSLLFGVFAFAEAGRKCFRLFTEKHPPVQANL